MDGTIRIDQSHEDQMIYSSNIYYSILQEYECYHGGMSRNKSHTPFSRCYDGNGIVEKGCVTSMNLAPSLYDALSEINKHRKERRHNCSSGDNVEVVSASHPKDLLKEPLNGMCIDSSLDESLPKQPFNIACIRKSARLLDSLDFFDNPVAAQQGGILADVVSDHNDPYTVMLPGTPPKETAERHFNLLDHIVEPPKSLAEPYFPGEQYASDMLPSHEGINSGLDVTHASTCEDLNSDDIIAFAKVNVMDCIDSIGVINDEASTNPMGYPGIHRDSDDAFALWVPIEHPNGSLSFYKNGEIYLKIVLRNSECAMNSISITSEEEIDNLISSPTVCRSLNTNPHDFHKSTISYTLDVSDATTLLSSAESALQPQNTDDFSSLLDESFHPSLVHNSTSSYSRIISNGDGQYRDAGRNECDAKSQSCRFRLLYQLCSPAEEYEAIKNAIIQWAYDPGEKIKDIRTLLYTLPQVLWDSVNWTPMDISSCASDKDIIKKYYRSALLICHPDKHMRADWRTALRAQLVTQALQEAWYRS
ncbi:hypothetical protein X943_002255 [Babesia divergens]|uniref:J domain-containing protein n=1 Tax=Babesia divergens TaxID=32595 RepID=A0AAD9GAK1_BABDI|nr:hypothetical protein X943_002255 [Babesia divergens]